MLFLSCQTGLAGAVKNAGRFAAEAEAQVIKIEAGGAYLDVIKAVSDGGDGPHWNKAAEYRQERANSGLRPPRPRWGWS